MASSAPARAMWASFSSALSMAKPTKAMMPAPSSPKTMVSQKDWGIPRDGMATLRAGPAGRAG